MPEKGSTGSQDRNTSKSCIQSCKADTALMIHEAGLGELLATL
jgi:hypothetical protein